MSTALIVVDVQRGFGDAGYWGRRNNPEAEDNIGRLIAAWRERGEPLVFVRHDSVEPRSPLRPGEPGNELHPVVAGEPDLLVTKHVNSAFYGEPSLHDWLRERGIDSIAVCGVQTNQCAETTARQASDLGYDVRFVLDATWTYDAEGHDGTVMTADELSRATANSLHDEFATIVTTDEVAG